MWSAVGGEEHGSMGWLGPAPGEDSSQSDFGSYFFPILLLNFLF